MNTPAHVIASCVLIPHKPSAAATSALVVGALAPDLPMFLFFAYQKLRGRTEQELWAKGTGLYENADWQLFFDWFNSIPLALLLMGVCWWMNWQWGLLCAASAALHLVCDFPLHNHDAHRHFLPFTHWRFISPVSYWDPAHFGRWTLPTELLLTTAGCLLLAWPGQPISARIVGATTLAIYVLFAGFALAMWSSGRLGG